MTKTKNKKLVIFFDGTWNSADQHSEDGKLCPTNVTKLFIATLPHDLEQNQQIIHYVPGVGTKTSERVRGGGFGYGISDNIKDGYKFLVSNYEDGDDIYIFGFSRGAYTARSLAGLIRNVGILTRDKLHLIDKAYMIYKDKTDNWHPDSPNSVAFKEEHTWPNERIKFLGVYDTVGALGAPFGIISGWIINKIFGCSFHDTRVSSIIENAYHAVAIDERRLIFQPTLMTPGSTHMAENFEQKWFAGVHSNVGGGYSNTGLSDIGLKWMAEKAQKHGLNLDLGKITHPVFAPNVKETANKSQTLLYKITAVLFVKLPGYLGLVPKKYKHTLPDIQWNGDYIRPIENPADIHESVFEKIEKCAGEYQPPNVKKL